LPNAPVNGSSRPRRTHDAPPEFCWNALADYWFRMEIDGLEQAPESPELSVGIHSGAYVDRKYREDSIQRGMDALARKRPLPPFG
jgi:hypothetical protein